MPEVSEHFNNETEIIQEMPHCLMQYFGYSHLPTQLQEMSKPFYQLAEILDKTLPDCGQKDHAFSLLLQAKDCAVRALLYRD